MRNLQRNGESKNLSWTQREKMREREREREKRVREKKEKGKKMLTRFVDHNIAQT